jgi:high-affinity iron transporter
MSSRSRKAERTARALLALIAASLLLAACGNSSHTPQRAGGSGRDVSAAAGRTTAGSGSGSAPGELITFGITTCGPNWRPLNSGRERFRISNGSPHSATVYLFRSDSGAVLTTLKDLPARTTRAVTVTLTPGVGYSWACDLSGHPVHLSDSEPAPRVGQSAAPKKVVAVYIADLIPALNTYRRYVDRMLNSLNARVATLLTATRSGDLPRARAAWLKAHQTWLLIGQDDGAYGAFGTLGQRIDGNAEGLVGGSASRQFTGFHRIERDLWVRRDLGAAATDTEQLQLLVARLSRQKLGAELPATKAGMTTFTIRTHEVLEDALRDTLSGDDNYGSDAALASLTADVTATREFLTILAPDIDPRAPNLEPTAHRELNAVTRAIAQARAANHGPTPIGDLPVRQRQQIAQSVGGALQTLSNVPDLLGIGGT